MTVISNKKPLVSVVTVCYNAQDTIERTIRSVALQDFNDFEYVVVDGGSTDGTINLIQEYKDNISSWITEKDSGVYDAMNKAVAMSKGVWIIFMNAGDVFYNNTVLSDIFKQFNVSQYGVVFGDTLFSGNGIQRVIKYGDNRKHKIMPSCHQSIFCKKDLLIENPFDLSYRIAADYNFFYKLYEQGVPRLYVDLIVSIYECDNGLSSVNKWKTKKELLKIENNSILYYIKLVVYKVFYLIKNR